MRRAELRYGHPVRPLAQQRLNHPLGFAVGLGPIGPREPVTDRPPATDGAQRVGAVRHRVIREEASDADAAAPEPRDRALQKRGTGGRGGAGQHLGIGEPRGIIDRHVEILPAHPPGAPAAIPVDAMANARHAPQALEIEVQQVADMRPLIPVHGGGGSSQARRLSPARAKTRVTVERGRRNATLICHAVARVRRNATTAASVGAASRRGCRWGRDDPSLNEVRARASHFATVRTLTPAASAACRCVHPSRRTRVMRS